MKKYLILLAVVAAAAGLPAQKSMLSGHIIGVNGEELVGVSLRVFCGKKYCTGGISDVQGFYRIPLDSGVYKLVIYYTGYEEQTIPDIRVAPNTTRTLDVVLDGNPAMKQVIVKEYKTPLLDEEHLPPPTKTERVSYDQEETPAEPPKPARKKKRDKS